MNEDQKVEQQAAYQAPPPAFLRQVIKDVKKEPEVKPGADREKLMLEFSQSDAWRVLRKYIEGKQLMLGTQLRESIGNSVEETGFRFIITDLTNSVVGQIINFVEAPAHAKAIENERDNNK